MWCAIGILAALQQRGRSGRGCIVDASLFETALGWMTYHITGLQASGENPIRRGSAAPGMVPYQVYPCSDGYLMVAAPNDKLFALLATVLQRPDLLQDARFSSNQQRANHAAALNAIIESCMRRHTRSHWRQQLDAAGIPNAPEQNTAEMMQDAQTRALDILQQLPGQSLQLMGLPLSFDGRRPSLKTLAPALGAHNEALENDKF
jgi:crotonobetainyl-CoA:carnitine CoA-transferase CaiB-like acyl-CoA transferase